MLIGAILIVAVENARKPWSFRSRANRQDWPIQRTPLPTHPALPWGSDSPS
jgi:hypothetical protein